MLQKMKKWHIQIRTKIRRYSFSMKKETEPSMDECIQLLFKQPEHQKEETLDVQIGEIPLAEVFPPTTRERFKNLRKEYPYKFEVLENGFKISIKTKCENAIKKFLEDWDFYPQIIHMPRSHGETLKLENSHEIFNSNHESFFLGCKIQENNNISEKKIFCTGIDLTSYPK